MFINISKQEVKVEFENNLYISMSGEAYQELMSYVNHCKEEVSGCGLVTKIEHKVEDDEVQYEFRIEEVFLPDEQTNTRASTNIEPSMVHKLMTVLIQEGKDTANLKLHWHSHVDMSVFHSGTDKDNYEILNNKEYLVSLVLNQSGDILGSVHLYSPVVLDVTGVPVYVDIAVDNRVSEKIQKNIEALDKYAEENKRIFMGAGYGSTWDSTTQSWLDTKPEKDTQKEKRLKKGKRKEIRKLLKLSDEQARRFDECDLSACLHCPDEPVCSEYMYAMMDVDEESVVDTYSEMMRNKHGYGWGGY